MVAKIWPAPVLFFLLGLFAVWLGILNLGFFEFQLFVVVLASIFTGPLHHVYA